MCRTVGGVVVLLLALPAWADDKPKDKPSTPQEQYQALLKEQQGAMQAFSDAYQKAKDDEERNKVIKEKYPTLAPKFLALAEKNPKDPVAFDALIWVVNNTSIGLGDKDNARAKAVALLLKDHVQSDKLGPVCQRLAQGYDQEGKDLLRGILDKNPSKDVQAEACLALAQSLKARADGMPEAKAKEAEKLRKESEEMYVRATDKFGDVKLGRGTVGEQAKVELYELRFLSIGKVAPEVEGEDADGKKFKLSDYRGKVVLIDFWGNW